MTTCGCLIEPLLQPWPRPVEDRLCLQGILYVLYNDIAWQLLPLEMGFGAGWTCWRRLERSQHAGVFDQLHRILLAELNAAGELDWSRACGRLPHPREKGGTDTGPSPVDRRKAGSEHHLICDGRGTSFKVITTAANASDVTLTLALVDGIPPVAGRTGRPRCGPDSLLGDKGYDSNPTTANYTTEVFGSGWRRLRWWVYAGGMRYPDGGGLTAVERARRERVRFQAAEMFAAGLKPAQVARALRVSRKSAYAWHAAWREGGMEALRSRGPSGVASRMKPGWRAWLARALEQGPAADCWTEDQRWTLARISVLVARRFHVRFSQPQLSWILRQMGFSVQVPVRRAAEQDEEQVRVWQQETWSRVERR